MCISDWCGKWRMKVNVDKTKVVHFRPLSILRTDTRFTCANSEIHIVDRYKYLGLILSEHLNYHITATMVAQTAIRALGLFIVKDKAHGGMPFICNSKLYGSLVQPMISYGAAIWGTKDYVCIAAVRKGACRYYMGLGKYAPNIALEGDTGWVHPFHRIWKCVIRQWCMSVNMCESRVNKRVFIWACNSNKANTWCSHANNFYRDRHRAYYADIKMNVNFKQMMKDIDNVLNAHHRSVWQQKLRREEANNGPGRNKIHTYRQFKGDTVIEPYLIRVFSKTYRLALAKFRCGVAPLHIETGRYRNIPEESRVCFQCANKIENELHVII